MKHKRFVLLFAVLFAVASLPTNARSDAKKNTRTEFKFKGSAGSVMRFLGVGKPAYAAEYVSGLLYRRDTLDKKGKVKKSQIIRLDDEVFIDINHKKKRYTITTFADWRAEMEEKLAKFRDAMGNANTSGNETSGDKPETEVKWKFDFDTSKPGETKEISGRTAEKVILTMKVEAEATTQDSTNPDASQKSSGGLIVNSTNWMSSDIQGEKEFQAFHLEFLKRLGMEPGISMLRNMTSRLMDSNPQLAAAMQKIKDEQVNLAGIPLQVHAVYKTWGQSDKKQAVEGEKKGEIPKSVGGLLRGFGKKKKKKNSDPSVLLETDMTAAYDDSRFTSDPFAIPAKYKEKKKKK